MQDNNDEKSTVTNDFFKSTNNDNYETTVNSSHVVSEEINPLTSDINKINQTVNNNGVIGEKEKSKRRKLFVSRDFVKNNESDDDELLRLYIGKNYYKISKGLINFAAIIFCPLYYLLRKMFILGTLIFVGLLFLHLKFNNFIIDAVYYVFWGLLFNVIYLIKSNRKVNSIKRKYADNDSYTIGRICSKSGGKSVILLILGIILDIVILIFFCANFYLKPMTKFLEKFGIAFTYENGNIKFAYDKSLINKDKIFDDKYGYYVVKSDIKSKDYFNMSTPNSHFTDSSDDSNYKFIYTIGNDSGFNACRIELFALQGYSTSTKFIEAVSNETKDEIKTTDVNGINWKYLHHEGISGTTFYYTTMVNDKVFLLKYYKDNTGIYDCMNFENDVLSSVKKK